MNSCTKKSIFFLVISSFCLWAEPTRLTIVLVIDQLAYRNLQKVRRYLSGGLRFLIDESIFYTQAHVPFATPSTGPAHVTLNTGVLPKTHGIINNSWPHKDMKVHYWDEDDNSNAAVFGPKGMQPYGRSPHFIMVDGLSDQLILQKQQHKHYRVFSLGIKSRSTIATANKLGKAIWLDPTTGIFTSSKAYFDTLPTWIRNFNNKLRIGPYTWRLYHCLPTAYRFKNIHEYTGAKIKQSIIGKTINVNRSAKKPYRELLLTPQANQLVLDLALACIDEYFCKDHADEKLFLWVLLGSLDKVGHVLGPNSIEAIDTLYHIDRQIKKFIDCVNSKTRKRNILWVLTSDHGITPPPEQMQKEGYKQAHRIVGPEVIKRLNERIKKDFDVSDFAIHFYDSCLFVNHEKLKKIDQEKRKNLIAFVKQFIEQEPGIKRVWTFDELEHLCFPDGSLEIYYKNQLFKGRSGMFIAQVYPYVYVSINTSGADHQTPYDYDTHVPLMIYQRAFYQRKIIDDPVYITQLAPTLAHILEVPKPSACTAPILPGIIYKEDPCF